MAQSGEPPQGALVDQVLGPRGEQGRRHDQAAGGEGVGVGARRWCRARWSTAERGSR